MKNKFVVDWALLPSSILSAFSGIKLHMLGHGMGHGACRFWGTFHIGASFVLLLLVIIHVKMHWNWYKHLFQKGLGNKSRTTVVLSLIFLLLASTGIILLGGTCRRSIIGIWHFHSGWLMIVLAVVHVFKRRSLL